MRDGLLGWVVALVWVGFFCLDLGQGIQSGSYQSITLLARWQGLFGHGAFVGWLVQPQSWQWLGHALHAYFMLPASVGIGGPMYLCYQFMFGRRGG